MLGLCYRNMQACGAMAMLVTAYLSSIRHEAPPFLFIFAPVGCRGKDEPSACLLTLTCVLSHGHTVELWSQHQQCCCRAVC